MRGSMGPCLAATIGLFLFAACGSNGPEDVAAADAIETAETAGPDVTAEAETTPEADAPAEADETVTDGDTTDLPAEVDALPDVVLTAIPMDTPTGFLERQAEYLAACVARGGPGNGGPAEAQICRVAKGLSVDPAPILDQVTEVAGRPDTSDFSIAQLLRLLSLDRKTHALDDDTRAKVEQAVLGFKYWLDEPGKDKMCYWSENHQILYHSNELIAGLLFPDKTFPNNGMTGVQHQAHAAPMITRWLGERARFGFSEWHSNVYFNEDMPALVNLADFAADDATRLRASMVLDMLAFDLLTNTYKGYFATVHGRTYEGHVIGGLNDSTLDAAWLMTGLGWRGGATGFTGAFMATSDGFRPAAILEQVAGASRDRFEHRQRDGINVADGPAAGIGYTDFNDIVFWAGMAAIAAPPVINGLAAMLDALDLWDAFLFGDLPAQVKSLLQGLKENGQLQDFATQVLPLSQGMALEAMSTYVWRTPRYQLAGAQDYKPGMWGTQTEIWQAVLDGDAYVLTTFPTEAPSVGPDVSFGGQWIGGWNPRATLDRNVGVIQYRYTDVPGVSDFLKSTSTHAYFPKTKFDEVRETGAWKIARKGDAYLALWSQGATTWSTTNDYELIAEGTSNVWIVELGSLEENGSFDAFADAIGKATVDVVDSVTYQSPSRGTVKVGWTGPMTVAGQDVDLGPYARWDNAFAKQAFATTTTAIEYMGRRYEMDFAKPSRTLFQVTYGPPPTALYDSCAGTTPPDDACYAEKRVPGSKNVEQAKAIAQRFIDVHTPESLAWNWIEAVGMVGLIELHRVTGEPKWQDYYRAWIDSWIAKGYVIHNSDTCLPAIAAIDLYAATGDPKYLKVVQDVLDFLFQHDPRDAEGGINHLGDLSQMGVTLWTDSLFMMGMVLNRWGQFADDERALHEYSAQFRLQTARQQGDSGFFTHASNWVVPQTPGVYWARGNAWLTSSAFEYLQERRRHDEDDVDVRQALLRQVDAIIGSQDAATGLWWTVINRPGETYLETSASALFAWGMARGWRYGWLDDSVLPVIKKAMAGVATRIKNDAQGRPVVTGTSGATDAGDYSNYANVPVEDDIPYGVGAVILALLETSGMPL